MVIDRTGAFIGRIAPAAARDSIFNGVGPHGPRSAESVWNPVGRNGERYGVGSARNLDATSPPRLLRGDRVVGLLTINRSLPDAVSPTTLGAVCYHFFPDR